eukprot:TRINITY_DN108216_c0_g1_i1.p1 TRINITY_DN108216_c0_g1~~TRINITY_DN108216_c0_g1_i1.p1  ORF type:complete len:240 (-),score=41.58 TRINITY_DN108216_c0_g1_i1:105-764(-)
MSAGRDFFLWYSQKAQEWPRATAALAGGMLTAIGDCIAQRAEASTALGSCQAKARSQVLAAAAVAHKEEQSKLLGSGKLITWDTRRTMANSCFSAAYASCVFLPFFGLLDRRFGEVGIRAVAGKVAADVFLLCPIVGIPSYFIFTGCVQGHTAEQIMQTMRCEYVSCFAGSACIWIIVKTITFAWVPAHLRVSFVYVGQISWATMMSFFANRRLQMKLS